MTGFQDLVIKQNIKIPELAREIGIHKTTMWEWLRTNKIPKKQLKILAEKFKVEESYLTKQVNDLKSYKPKPRGSKNEYKIVDDYVIIYIYRKNGEVLEAYIDLEDLDKFLSWKYSWSANPNTKNYYYVITNIYENKRDGKSPQTITLHRYILDLPENCDIDHINHNGLDNRKSNLRITPHKKNMRNRKSKNSNNKSGYRNVCWDKSSNKWMVQLMVNNKNTVLGRFKDVEEAGKFAEEMRKKYYGEFSGES